MTAEDVAKTIMKIFTSLRLRNLVSNAGWLKLGLVVWAGLMVNVGRAAAPPNDNYTNATVLIGNNGSTNGSNVGATLESGEPYAKQLGASVWYKWTASSNETTEFDLKGSVFSENFGYVLVYTNGTSSISNLQLFAVGFIQGGVSTPASFQAASNHTYYISVVGVDATDTSAFKLNWSSSAPQLPPSNDNFANATVLSASGSWGTVKGTNTFATAEPNEPTHVGQTAAHSVWFQWTPLQSGDVELDTLGSGFDTILAVYTGTSLGNLAQVAANDDIYPAFQNNQMGQFIYNTNIPNQFTTNPFTSAFNYGYNQPFQGPSGLHFNAVAGTTYYFAVDGKNGLAGAYSLNWAYQSSGVFRFATEGVEQTGITDTNGNPMLLYQCAETESSRRFSGTVNADQYNTTLHSYYNFDAPGVLVTVTRVAGSSGRVLVDYTTVDGNTNMITNGDQPALAGRDYSFVGGTLVFDDFEMSKTILIPIIDNGGPTNAHPNRDFSVVLSNPRLDSAEDTNTVSRPRVDQTYYQALVRILDVDIDPKGETKNVVVTTNGFLDAPTNLVPNLLTNTYWTPIPTNAVLNFQKANYRVTRDITNWWGGTPITVYVTRTGTNNAGASAVWRVNNQFLSKLAANDNGNITFPLQPGSDYATPFTASPPKVADIFGSTNFDFNFFSGYNGTVSFGSGSTAYDPQPITFTIYDNGLSQFNEDFHIDLYQLDSNGNPIPAGMVAETTVTILYDDLHPPAGSVDEYYNPDFSLDIAPPINVQPLDQPGTDGDVYGVAVEANNHNETIIVGDFTSYDGVGRGCIALVSSNGLLDTSFAPVSGANDFIHSVALTANNEFLIGGGFTSYNNIACGGIALVKADGSLDTTFLNGLSGATMADGSPATVWAVAVQSDGKVVVGGDFQHINGTPLNYIARLNIDGSVDTSFNPGTTLNGPVYALALPAGGILNLTNAASGGSNEVDQAINLGTATAGTLAVTYDMSIQPDDMRVFYGNTNVAAGTGVLIYDTGSVSFSNNFVLPFGPTNGLSTNVITIVMDQGGGAVGTAWDFSATVTTAGSGNEIMVGGDFAVNGQSYSDIARLSGTNGLLDTSFNPGAGADNPVFALAWQPDGRVVVGGSFTHINNQPYNFIARLNNDGSIDTTNFFPSIGANNTVYNLTLQLDGTIYVGGDFTSFNGTHRLGFTRLYSDGTVDTTFLDTAYNQFAGLPRIHFNDRPNVVFTSGVQSDGNVIIGGRFSQVGGGQFDPNVRPGDFVDPNTGDSLDQDVYGEPKTRDGVRNRNNVARLIGGATPGPGNVGLLDSTYSIPESQSFIYALLSRTNGSLGYASANFSVQPGLAKSGTDYTYYQPNPLYPIDWEYRGPSRMHSDGLFGDNVILSDVYGEGWSFGLNGVPSVIVSVSRDALNRGNLNAQFQLANPVGADQFYLGGQNIPLSLALGRSGSPFTLIDDTTQGGTFGFAAPGFVATNSSAAISLVRSNGTYGTVSLQYSTSNSTAIAGTDYTAIPPTIATFLNGQVTNGFNVSILGNGIIYTGFAEKFVNLRLSNLSNTTNANFGLSNAVLRLINPNFQGYLTLSTNIYYGTESSGFITFTVNRVSGSLGTVSVRYATTNGTAFNGVDYVGTTNQLTWNSGDVSPKVVSVPLINSYSVGGNKQFSVFLFNPTNSSSGSAPTLLQGGPTTNATMVIVNDNSYGTVQFSAPSYLVNENGGYATVTVNRTGGVAGPVSVSYMTTNGTAVAGVNYVRTNGTLSFTTNQLSASFNVAITNDGVVDPANFYFNVLLTNSSNAALGPLTNSIVNIVDAQAFNQPPGSTDPGFNPGAGMNGDVLALAMQTNGQILAGGNFTTFNNAPQNYIVRLNTDGSLDTTFLYGPSAGANGSVFAVASQTDGRVLVGGAFSQVSSVGRRYIARLMTDGTVDTSFDPGAGADGAVYALAETFIGGGREIYVGGAFGHVNGATSLGIARMNNDGTADASFTTGSGADGSVYAIAVYPTNSVYAGKLLIGGAFTHYNGTSLNYIARLNVDGSVDTTFNPGAAANASVNAIAIQPDGRVLVGGNFTNFNGTVVNRITRLNNDGSVDANFVTGVGVNVGANNTVAGIVVQPDNRIVLVGQFTQAGGVTRNRITRLLPTGAVDPTINFGDGANGNIAAAVIQLADGKIVIGGGFTQYNDQPANHIARIYGGSVTGSGAFTFTSANYQVDENGGQALLTIRRTGGTSGTNSDGSGNVAVHFATGTGTAVANVNYTPQAMDLNFPAGEVLETVFIPVFDDGVITPPLTLTNNLSISPLSPATLGVQPSAVLTILNDDSAVSFAVSNYYTFKNAGTAAIDVIRQFGTNGTCSVDFYTTTNGTAVAGTDYYPTNVTITFNPGQTDLVVYVSIISNSVSSGNTTLGLLLTNANNTVLYAPSNATLTIQNPVPGPGQVSFATTNYVANEGDGTAYLMVVRTNGSDPISVNYTLVPGTAQPGINYTGSGGNIAFGVDDTSERITVPLVQNTLVQGTVNLSVFLSGPTGGATLISPTNATLNIVDDNLGFVFLNATNYVSETNAYASVFVQCVGNPTNNATVQYNTSDGTATNGINYIAVSGTLTNTPGETLQAILVPLIDNTNMTGNLTFNVKLSNPSIGTQLGVPSNSVVVLQAAQAGLSFTNPAVSVLKNSGSLVVAVVCSNTNAEPAIVNSNTVPLSVFYSTADGSGVANQDYIPVSGTLAFTNGIATNYFTVPILNNSLVIGDRTFSVNLSNPTPPGQITPFGTQNVTIIDNNSGLSFSSPTYTVLKSGVAATITILRTDNTNTTSSVNFATADGTAVANSDYLPTNGTCIFTNGQTSQTFSVIVINNTIVQPDKTVLLQLFNPTNGILLSPYAATLTIHDTSGSYVVPAGSTLISESGPTNGIIDPGETVSMWFAFRDAGGNNVADLRATLLSTNGVTSPSGLQDYGPLIENGPSVSRQFQFTAGPGYTNGQQIVATFQLTNVVSGVGTNLGTASFTFTLGSWSTTYSNTAPIIINDYAIASPYPSTITVSNFGGVVVKAVVTLTNISHSSPEDIEVLLVSPYQQDTLLMSRIGAQNTIKNVTLTFDDAATNVLYQTNQIISGTYPPTNYPPLIIFP